MADLNPQIGLTLALMAHIPADGVDDFQTYENLVLPLLTEHGGYLQRRLRGHDGAFELHLVRFPSAAHFENYRADPRRSQHASLVAASRATLELIEVTDVAVA
jgi:hypothetical protein